MSKTCNVDSYLTCYKYLCNSIRIVLYCIYIFLSIIKNNHITCTIFKSVIQTLCSINNGFVHLYHALYLFMWDIWGIFGTIRIIIYIVHRGRRARPHIEDLHYVICINSLSTSLPKYYKDLLQEQIDKRVWERKTHVKVINYLNISVLNLCYK